MIKKKVKYICPVCKEISIGFFHIKEDVMDGYSKKERDLDKYLLKQIESTHKRGCHDGQIICDKCKNPIISPQKYMFFVESINNDILLCRVLCRNCISKLVKD